MQRGKSKIRAVLWYFLFALIAILILVWFVSGGVSKVESAAQHFQGVDFLSLSGIGTSLPWAIQAPQGPDISQLVGSSTLTEAQDFGNPSPYEGVSLSAQGAYSSDPQQEYVVIQNNSSQTLDLSGWSLQSAITGARAYIPLGAAFFQMGALNALTNIELPSGGVAIVTTGESPVGASFRLNTCSGYLNQLQRYTPSIESECPSPISYAQAAAQFGQSCADFVASLPVCTFPQNMPHGLSTACEAYAQTELSYNGCVQQTQNSPAFSSGNWRVYLGVARELWGNGHDTIRLLDAEGQVAAVTSY